VPPLDAIADAGGWAFAGFVLLSVIVAIIAGKLVPGPLMQREIGRGDRLEAQGLRLTRRVSQLERGLDRCREEVRQLKRRSRHAAP